MTKQELLQDIKFLAERQSRAGSFGGHGNRRFVGISSNSIVSIAYGIDNLGKQRMPFDASDVQSCINMWTLQMPEHRKKGDALKAYKAAINCDWSNKEAYRQCPKCECLVKKEANKCDWCE